jgi:tetratricopeptide (TPR) repeat protein
LKPHWLFPTGCIVGAALVWAFLRPGCADPLGDAPDRAAREAPATVVVSEPEDRGSVEALTDAVPDDLETPDGSKARVVRFHSSLATAYALTDRLPGFLEHTALAIGAGARARDIQKIVYHFPDEHRAIAHEALATEHPKLDWSRTNLAQHYASAGNSGKAFSIVVEELGKNPDNPKSLIRSLIAMDAALAATHLRDLARAHEWDADRVYLVAHSLNRAKQAALAQTFLVDALMLSPLHGKALALLTTLDPEKALGFAAEATRQAPTDQGAWGRLAKLRLKTGDNAGAYEAFHLAAKHASPNKRAAWLRGMLNIDPKAALASIRVLTDPASEDSLHVLGQALVWNGLRGEAFDAFAGALAINRTNVGALHQLVISDPARAVDHLSQTLEDYTGTSSRDEIIGARAIAYLELGEGDRAFTEFLEASNLDQNDYEWLRGMAAADPVRAAQHLEERLEDSPESGNVLGALGDAYAGLGRKDDAGRMYDKAIGTGSSLRWRAALVRADPKRGLAMLNEALAKRPNNDEAWGALGDAYRDLGRIDDARDAYTRALKLDPADWEWDIKRDQLR